MVQITRKHRTGANSRIASHKQRISRVREPSKPAAGTNENFKLFDKKTPLKSLISAGFWSEMGDSNARPDASKPPALPTALIPDI